MDNKFKLVDVSPEESAEFQKEFTALLEKGSYYFEPVPQYQRVMIKNVEGKDVSGWMTVNSLLLQKKVPIDEPKEAEIVSPLSEELTGNATA